MHDTDLDKVILFSKEDMNYDNNSIETHPQDYPRFISNQPCGEDKTEGNSQKRLSNAIAEHITSTDSRETDSRKTNNNIPRIIGLKGEWGVGKSNVIRQLQENKKIKSDYYIFEYDAWGHQEDLQRRSFLETLTERLLNDKEYNNYLSKGKKVVKSWETGNNITWKEKLNEILARKRITHNKSIPVFNGGALWTALFLSLTPISTFIAERLEAQKIVTSIPLLGLIAFCPILLGLIVWGITCIFNKDARSWGYLLKISKDITTSVKNFETINEEEPSVAKFSRWMNDLSNYISKQKKPKLIIVYDNMDRLPADKVKELWSSIHTFFSENGFPNIWVIIPFDEKHLSCAFGESNDREQLTKHFINKIFPIVYRVTPPVITDYKKLFEKMYNEAFGNTEETYKQDIFRIFRLEKPNATIREMIEFINSLVTLKQIWKSEIDLLFCAVFKIKEKEIIENSFFEDKQPQNNQTSIKNITIEEKILSGKYLGYISNIVANDETLQTNIAALVYGVSKDFAIQIPMKKYIEYCFENNGNTGGNINRHSKYSVFISVLKDSIENADFLKTDGIIKCLSILEIDSFSDSDKNIITALWDSLVERKESQELSEQKFDDSYKSLLLNITDRQGLVKRFCRQLQKFEFSNKSLIFSGTYYYNALKDLQDFLSKKNIDIDITDYLEDIEKEPQIFVEYVQAAKENYKTFKLSTDNDKLNDFLECDDPTVKCFPILKYLKDDPQYKFDKLKQKIESFIPSSELTAENFKPIFDAYKLISSDKPLEKQLSQNQINQIENSLSAKVDTEEYLEIATILLANNQNTARDLNEQEIEYIATQMDYYGNYGDLLINSNNENLNRVLKYMTENRLGHRLSLKNIMPHFLNIKNKINVSESILFTQLNQWSKYKDAITKGNIANIIPAILFRYTKETINELTNHINKTAIDALAAIDENTVYSQLSQSNQYWYQVTDNLIDTSFCKPLPENLFNIGIRYLNEIASQGIIPKDNDVKAKIINKLDKRKTGSTIEKIRDSFCNSQSDITPQNFLYLESWLRQQGKLNNRAGEVIHRIIDPIINDENCLRLLVDNSDFYAKIINTAGDDASATKQIIQQKINTSEDAKLLAFAKKIGINKEGSN